ncbi:MbtH family NRPS accessory protein [Streptomyces sp. NPDC001985]|uniref:MbtH family NRPS accessory protein n=1 Tax=Streptomyces sp. NPDC001985 TaxID=3154406 RepID=UPI00332037BB
MPNPAERADDHGHVLLTNGEGLHGLWPAGARVPEGWERTLDTPRRKEGLEAVLDRLTGLRPVTFTKRSALPH